MGSQRSDDARLALDLMAQSQDPQWALAAARIEEEAHCDSPCEILVLTYP